MNVLIPYCKAVEKSIRQLLPLLSPKNELRDACEYALTTGGKRFRPSIVLMVAEALNAKSDVSFSALSIELFHTASLVADDLPSMDDDDERRDAPSVHKKFGEGVALLASYALISAGYECIFKNAEAVRSGSLSFSSHSDRLCALALECAAYNTGLMGATGGQFLDIEPPSLSLAVVREIIHKKTSSLFEIAFVFGWLFGGGDIALLDEVKKAASHFGLAFQVADDLGDMEQDLINKRLINTANLFGRDVALKMFHEEQNSFLLSLKRLGLGESVLGELLSKALSPKKDHKDQKFRR